jgi:hypothetical protein
LSRTCFKEKPSRNTELNLFFKSKGRKENVFLSVEIISLIFNEGFRHAAYGKGKRNERLSKKLRRRENCGK